MLIFFPRMIYLSGWLMIVCSLKCFNFLQHGIIRMVIIGIGILGFLGPSFIE